MQWTFAGIAALALWADYLAWFVLVLARRVRAAELGSTPLIQGSRAQAGDAPAASGPSGHQLLRALCRPRGAVRASGRACLVDVRARYVTSKVVPLSLVFLGLYGFTVVREFARGVPWVTRYGIAGGGSGSGYAQLDLVQAFAFLATGLWLTWRRMDPDSRVSRMLLREPADVPGRRGRPRWGLLLLLV